MGFGDFAPPAGGNMKRVTKAALRRMAEKFQQADAISEETAHFILDLDSGE